MELLAPAGNLECVRAAADSGADAVYFAGQSFGARSFAGNLTDDEIFFGADYCHLLGVKTYVTVNTLMFDREFKDLDKFVQVLTKAGIDGVIVQDLGVLNRIKQISPDIEVHASTQMTVHSADGVKLLQNMGVSRVVLSRELSADEIKTIAENTTAELEVFVHGAMCMSYSGQCLMSSVIGGRSGNRGKCAQPCRLAYSSEKNQKALHFLSLKDMSLVNHIKQLTDMGVASLKIEGRMKSAEYVSAVVKTYRKLIDEQRPATPGEISTLNNIFNRGGLTDGYFTGKTGKPMFAFNKPDNPYLKNEDTSYLPDKRKIKISMEALFKEGAPPTLCLKTNDCSISVKGETPCASAQNRPLTKENAIKSLEKLGDTPFSCDNISVDISGAPFVPVSEINNLRRLGTDLLTKKILSPYKNKSFVPKPFSVNPSVKNKEIPGANNALLFSCSVLNANQLWAAEKLDFKYIYVPLHIIEDNLSEILNRFSETFTERIVISTPVIISDNRREEYVRRIQRLKDIGFKHAEVSLLDTFSLTDGFVRHGSFRLNVTNNLAADAMARLGLHTLCMSTELTEAQIHDINPINTGYTKEAVVYGRIPLMITKNCILNNMDKCPCNGYDNIYDRTDRPLPVIKDGDICASVVLNSVPLYLGDKKDVLDKLNAHCFRFIFTTESPEDCIKIFNQYKVGAPYKDNEYTRLRFLKSPLS